MQRKFKVGDRVKIKKHLYLENGSTGVVSEVFIGGVRCSKWSKVKVGIDPLNNWYASNDQIELCISTINEQKFRKLLE